MKTKLKQRPHEAKKKTCQKTIPKIESFFILKKQKQLCQRHLLMKDIILLYDLIPCSILILSAHGTYNDNGNDINENDFVQIKHELQKEKPLGLFYKASCFITGKTYTDTVFDFIDKEGILNDQGYKTRVANNIEHGIQEQITAITTINKELENPTIEKMLSNQKNKLPHILNLKKLIHIGDTNLLQIRDRNKINAILTLNEEMNNELTYITEAIILSYERHKQAALLAKKINQGMQNPMTAKKFPTYDMKHFIAELTKKIPETAPEDKENGEKG